MSALQVFEREDGRYGWHLKAGNGRIIAGDAGQGYENRGDCERTAEAVVRGAYAPNPEGVIVLTEPVLVVCGRCHQSLASMVAGTLDHAYDGAHVFTPTIGGR